MGLSETLVDCKEITACFESAISKRLSIILLFEVNGENRECRQDLSIQDIRRRDGDLLICRQF